MQRRKFLKLTGSATATAMLTPGVTKAATTAAATLYEVHDPKMTSGTRVEPASVNQELVINSIHSLARKMGKSTGLGTAWQNILKGITPASKVAIKINCLIPESSPQFCTIKGIVKGLTSMFGGTFPAANIMLFDNDLGGNWIIKSDKVNIKYGSAELDKLGIWHAHDTYKGPSISLSGRAMKVSTAWSQGKNFCINLLCPRRHQSRGGYLSGHIKNMMGAVSLKADTYAALAGEKTYFHHPTNFGTYVDLMKNPNIGRNTALYISDYILVPRCEAAAYSKFGNRITFGTDPCAMDSHAVDVLNEVGLKAGTKSATKKVPQALAASGGGTISYQIVKVAPGSGGEDPPPSVVSRMDAEKAIYNAKKGTSTPQATQITVNGYLTQ